MALIERIIDARLASDERGAPRDLFDLLRSARDPETGAAFTREQLRDQVATMIVAGHETTALALFWSLYLLANATGWQDAIAAETSGLDLGPEGAADALASLVQTRAVVSEALRLYPPAFTMMRVAIGPDRAGDLRDPPRRRADDRALGDAPPPPALARSRRLRSIAFPARSAATAALRLPSLRRRPSRLRRRPVCDGGGDAGSSPR